ncbi:MAG: hypothetical protein BGO43_08915 [Gammaproteobacteria bacterium 39-13]|nr:hypothetical protein [Gammaproteobacteria bacterium]OJV94361.1 MAG: hypothetical protein BGO43_08915 [Gammaproteobacteria bacterium 39-13]
MASNGPNSTTPPTTTVETQDKKKPASPKKRPVNPLWEGNIMPSILKGAREHNARLGQKAKAMITITKTEPQPASASVTSEKIISAQPTSIVKSPKEAGEVKQVILPSVTTETKLSAQPTPSMRCEESLDDFNDRISVAETQIRELKAEAEESKTYLQLRPAALSPYSKAIIKAQLQGVYAAFKYREQYKDQYTEEEFNNRIKACAKANKKWKAQIN